MMFLLTHNSVTEHSGADVLYNYILNKVTIHALTVLTNGKIFRQKYIMKLNDSTAMTML